MEFTFPALPEHNPIADMARRFWEGASDDMKACLVAGCAIEFGSESTPAGLRMMARTKNKVGIVRDRGRVTVFEQRA